MKNNRFLLSFVLSSGLLLAANTWFILEHNYLPDGRMAFILPVTSLFILLYVFFLHRLDIKYVGKEHPFFMLAYTAIVSVLFIVFGRSAQFAFASITPEWLLRAHLFLIPYPTYVILLGSSIAIYPLMGILMNKKLFFTQTSVKIG